MPLWLNLRRARTDHGRSYARRAIWRDDAKHAAGPLQRRHAIADSHETRWLVGAISHQDRGVRPDTVGMALIPHGVLLALEVAEADLGPVGHDEALLLLLPVGADLPVELLRPADHVLQFHS